MTPTRSLPALSAVAAAILLGACGGSSSGPDSGAANPRLEAQAIDGYLFNSEVFCDGTENGKTGLAGKFDCPLDTELFLVRGGLDVGFDESARTGSQFIGELKAPATLAFVTPLSTIAVNMSSDENGTFDASRFDDAVAQVAAVVGESGLDLNADPSKTMQLVKLNAQINTLVAEFGGTEANYTTAIKEFAAVISKAASDGASYNLVSGIGEIAEQINARLIQIDPSLAKSEAELTALTIKVQEANQKINAASTPDAVTVVVEETAPPAPVLTIDRDEALVSYSTSLDATPMGITLADFESDEQSGQSIATADGSFDAYGIVVTGDTNRLAIGEDAYDVGTSLSDETVTLGFELDATEAEDSRYFSVTTSDAKLTTDATTDSMMLALPQGAMLTVEAVDTAGTRTNTTVSLDKGYEFSSENGGINVSFWDIDEQLMEEGFGDVTEEAGNFRLTAVVGSLRIAQSEQGVVTPATPYTVDAGVTSVTGAGFQGYITLVPPSEQ